MVIGVFLCQDCAYSQPGYALRVPLIIKWERILSAYSAALEKRLRILEAGELVSAIERAPEKYSFIMDNHFLIMRSSGAMLKEYKRFLKKVIA